MHRGTRQILNVPSRNLGSGWGRAGRTDKHILQKVFNAMKGMCRVPGGGTWAGGCKADGASDFSEEATVKQTKILDMRQREPGKEGVISGKRKTMCQGLKK